MRILKGIINIHKDLKKNVKMGRWGMEDIKKNQIELLQLKNTIPGRKNSRARVGSRLNIVEKKLCDTEDITIESIQTKTHRGKD